MDRRGFLAALGGGALAWPGALVALARRLESGGGPTDQAFWEAVRSEFLIPPDRIYLNNGTLGPSPRVVVEAVTEHTRRVAATYPPAVEWDQLKSSMAALLGADADGFVFPRNTTEAMSFVANGLELDRGDEVVTTDHEHIGGLEPWRLLAARRGIELRVASLPMTPTDPGELLDAVWAPVGRHTRVVSVSHVTFTNGAVLPVRRLADRCAEAGITLVVDGAHPPGMMRLELSGLGVDFYASSPHKWLLAPQGTGLLFLAPAWRRRLWPTLASGGWDDQSLGAHRFNHLGTFDASRLVGLLAAAEFLQTIGMERVEARVRYLRGLLASGLASVPRVTLASPASEDMTAGMVSFRVGDVDPLDLQAHLARTAQVRTRVISEYGYDLIRLSTHVYNQPREIERTLELLERAAQGGVPPRGDDR